MPTDSISLEVYNLADQIVMRRVKQGVDDRQSVYRVCTSFSLSAWVDYMAAKRAVMSTSWVINSPEDSAMLIEHEGVFALCSFAQKSRYCSMRVRVWAASEEKSKAFEQDFKNLFDGKLVSGSTFALRWAFQGRNGLDEVYIEEIFEDVLRDEAYPELASYGGVNGFIQQFLASDETVLILQGAPGTGKTRLTRAILAAMAEKAKQGDDESFGAKATALYTGDANALKSDEIFARFIGGGEEAFVVEDADHMLRPRADGNDDLHRFLAIADGVVKAAGRKIIFSTNLPNISDLDDALIRPGRCFARVTTREFGPAESEALVMSLCEGDAELSKKAMTLFEDDKAKRSVAEIYKAVKRARAEQTSL